MVSERKKLKAVTIENEKKNPNFKIFYKFLNKRIMFPLEIKSVFASLNEEFLKIYFST